MVIISKAYNIS